MFESVESRDVMPLMGLDWVGGIQYPIVALSDALFLPPFYKTLSAMLSIIYVAVNIDRQSKRGKSGLE